MTLCARDAFIKVLSSTMRHLNSVLSSTCARAVPSGPECRGQLLGVSVASDHSLCIAKILSKHVVMDVFITPVLSRK